MGLYNALFIGGLILAILFLIASVIIFFVLKIPKVFGDLTGITMKKSIEEIGSSGTGKTADNNSRITVRKVAGEDTGNLTDNSKKAGATKQTVTKKSADYYNEGTEILGSTSSYEDQQGATEILGGDGTDSTDVLTNGGAAQNDNSEATDVLTSSDYYNEANDGATDVLTSGDTDATDVLSSDDGGATDVLTSGDTDATDVLSSPGMTAGGMRTSNYSSGQTARTSNAASSSKIGEISYVYNIVEVHTDEILTD